MRWYNYLIGAISETVTVPDTDTFEMPGYFEAFTLHLALFQSLSMGGPSVIQISYPIYAPSVYLASHGPMVPPRF